MILNNYNGSLKENKETSLTFFALKSPKVFVHLFTFDLVEDTVPLIIPYYVTDAKDSEYKNCTIGPTFTTIIAFDEDTKSAEEVRVVKRTTYAGEFVFDFSDTEEFADLYTVGVHSFSIRTIQSNGIGSATQYFKYIVREAITDNDILDMDALEEQDEDGNFIFTGSLVDFESPERINNNRVRVTNADFTVKVKRANNTAAGEVERIDIVVENGTYEYYSISSEFTRGTLQSNETKDISGIYTLAFKVKVNVDNNDYEKPLMDARKEVKSYPHATDPRRPWEKLLLDAAVLAGAGNKVALTRLFEAAKGAGKRMLKLPANMNIVVDHRRVDGSTSFNPEYPSDVKLRDDIRLPNEFTVDMNGSAIYVMNCETYSNGKYETIIDGSIFHFYHNHDSHLINGKLVGTWEYNKYQTLPGPHHQAEYQKMLINNSSTFCSLENLDISFSGGYEIITKATVGDLPSNQGEADAPQFTEWGYIDYEGNEVNLGVDPNNTLGDTLRIMRISANKMVSLKKVNTMTFFTKSLIRIMKMTYRNRFDRRHRQISRDMFVHFYDKNRAFLKTIKVEETFPILYPYGAEYMTMSMIGFSRETANSIDEQDNLNYLKYLDGTRYHLGAWSMQRIDTPWCCAVRNCYIHDTRTTLFDDGAIQQVVDSCTFSRVSCGRNPLVSEEYRESLTPHLFDLEDESNYLYNYYINNCEVYRGNGNINMCRGYNYFITNCRSMFCVIIRDVADTFVENSAVEYVRNWERHQPYAFAHLNNNILNNVRSCYDTRTKDPGASTVDLTIRGELPQFVVDTPGYNPSGVHQSALLGGKMKVIDSNKNQ